MGHCSASFLLLSLLLLSGTSYLHTVTFGFCNADPNVGCMDIERKALLKLREGLSDPSDRLSSWGGVDCCNWRGIGCNKTTGRVESLNLHNPYAEGLGSDGDDGTLHALGDLNVGCMNVERRALLELKQNLTDPMDRLSSWVGEDCCKWRGVGCNKKTGRVISLNLRNPFSDGLDVDDGALHALGDNNVGCMSIEMKALLKLKEGLRDHSDQLSSWIGEDCCKWKVVGCNNNLSE